YTPSKRIRLMTAAISNTASGSFLVSKTPITVGQSIPPPVLERPTSLPEPNWDLLTQGGSSEWQSRTQLEMRVNELTANLHMAHGQLLVREGIIKSAHAQLIIQNLHVTKLQQALETKEKKKKTDRTKLFPKGNGRHLTAEEFIQELEEAEQERLEKTNRRTQRKEDLAVKRAVKEAVEIQWKEICAKHEQALLMWEHTCADLTAQKVPQKNHPKRPVR
ncbi:hypothetical protein JB92DRAFT_2616320, partial [Gautieria morchelliformis]